MITVLIGILMSNGRLSNLEHTMMTRFDLPLSKMIEFENRLTRLETQGR